MSAAELARDLGTLSPVSARGDDAAPQFSISIGTHSVKGHYHANEDRVHATLDARKEVALPLKRLTHVILLDGHDGDACAEFAKQTFLPLLDKSLEASCGGSKGLASMAEAGYSCDDVLAAAHASTFLAVEAAWEERVAALETARVPASGLSSGACCTSVLVTPTAVLTANIGDARAIFRRSDGSVDVLTEDHRCCNDAERRRIIAEGGFIADNRVMGRLEPTRTFGDLEEKL